MGTLRTHTTSLIYAGLAVVALFSAAPAHATGEIKADPSVVSAGSGAGTQVRTSATQGDIRMSGTQGEVRNTIKAVPGVRAHGMPTPNSCDGLVDYTCD